jgi:two-component system, sensor histidine kinase and response regulator
MDWRMPEMDGIEAANTILKDKSIDHVPMAIMVSAFGREEVSKKAEKIGINTFLMKPINQSLLFETIVNLFEMDKNDITVQSAQGDNAAYANNRLDGISILLVEDNTINQEVATEILSCAGARVEIANNGKEAVDAVATGSYDLVLMDLQMPVMGGYEATKLIRADKKNADLPIIAMTAHAMQGVQAECIAAGMNDYTSKPIDPDNLYTMIKKWTKPAPAAHAAGIQPPSEPVGQGGREPELPGCIPGIDLEAGIARVNGNGKLFKKLLLDFGRNGSSYTAEIRKSLTENNIEDAKRAAHTLKGVAGNISATDILNIATQLDQALAGQESNKYKALLADLDKAMRALENTLREMEQPAQTDDTPAQYKANATQMKPVLKELARFIWENNVDAEKTVEELRKLCGSKYAKETAVIAEKIEEFDFDAAKEPMKKLAAELNIRLDGMQDE